MEFYVTQGIITALPYFMQIEPVVVVFREYASEEFSHTSDEDDIGYDLAQISLVTGRRLYYCHIKLLVFRLYDYW